MLGIRVRGEVSRNLVSGCRGASVSVRVEQGLITSCDRGLTRRLLRVVEVVQAQVHDDAHGCHAEQVHGPRKPVRLQRDADARAHQQHEDEEVQLHEGHQVPARQPRQGLRQRGRLRSQSVVVMLDPAARGLAEQRVQGPATSLRRIAARQPVGSTQRDLSAYGAAKAMCLG